MSKYLTRARSDLERLIQNVKRIETHVGFMRDDLSGADKRLLNQLQNLRTKSRKYLAEYEDKIKTPADDLSGEDAGVRR
jgi:Fic family protein